MNLKQLVQYNTGDIALLFQAYGINKPVTVETVSAAVALHSDGQGNNPFAEDLASIAEANYEDWFGGKLVKKVIGTKETRQAKKEQRAVKREERGGSRLGVGLRNLKQKVSQKAAAKNNTSDMVVKSELQSAAETAPMEQQSKITVSQVAGAGSAILGGVSDTINSVKDVFSGGGSGGGGGYDENGGGSGGEEKTGMKKYLPWILGGVGLLVVTIVVVAITRKK